MEVIIAKGVEQASEWAAHVLKNQVKNQPKSVLGLATGSTPLKLYLRFAEIVKKESLPLDRIHTFNLDEYVGVAPEHPGSYAHYMQKHFVQPLGLKAEQFHIPNGMAADIPAECAHYEALIAAKGPIDLQILGLGQDGHVGFNEPGSSLGSRTRLKSLTASTRSANQPLFSEDEELPRHVITMGVQTIMEAEKIMILAFGEKKAQAVADMVEGSVTSFVPASALQFHPSVKVFLDPAAAKKLQNRAYYEEVFAHKPAWQMAEFI